MSLFWKGQSIQLSAFIDSGADESFIDAALASQLDLPSAGLDQPLRASTLDRRLLANLIHTGQCQYASFCQVTTKRSLYIPVILGHTWLVKHNPHIDWRAGKIIEWSLTFHATCLLSAQPQSVPSVDPCGAPDLSAVPTDYHNLQAVFSK